MNELLGKTLDRTYRIDQRLGRGGMGAVYRARDVVLNRDVALKVLHSHFAEDGDFRARFLQEARAIAALDHPSIVRVHAFGQDLGLLYIIMDFIPGQDLHGWLDRLADEAKIVVLRESLDIVRRVAWALHYAHSKGVLHRDIKPSNIMLKLVDPALLGSDDLAFRPILTDFGLAKLAEGGIQTRTGASMGTPAYMSPEQCLGLEPDRRADVYALGIVLFELATGRVPFQVKSLTEAIRCHTQEPPPPPRSINSTLPTALENIILRALSKRREDRFATAHDMADAIQAAMPGIPSGMTVVPTHADGPKRYISLMTRLEQQSMAPAQPHTELWEAPPLTGQPGASLVAVSPDGTSRRIPLDEKQALAVGRDEGSDLRLIDPKASRHHARIEFSGSRLTVTDLNSTNGTFLGNSRLLPGVSQPWPPGTKLRIGDHWLTFQVQAAPATSVAASPLVQPIEPLSPTAPRATISLEPGELTVEAGQSATAQLRILNQGTQVDHYRVSVEGIPADWVPALPPVIRLLPGEEREVTLTILPPRSPQSRAGLYALTVLATSQQAPDRVSEARSTLTVAAFYEYDLALHPQRQNSIAEGSFKVRVHNRGNADLTVAWEATDPEEGCRYSFDPPQALLPPDQDCLVALGVRPIVPLPGAIAKTYPFIVTARPVEAPYQARQVQGQWTHVPPAFELMLHPQRQSGLVEGAFSVQVSNQSTTNLTVQLEATDPEESCLYVFDPPRVTVPPGQERLARLKLRPRASLSVQASKTHAFTVTARPTQAPRVSRRVQGEWVQIPLAFEIALRPQRQSGTQVGTFGVEIGNSGPADLVVQLEAADAEGSCLYAFDPSRVSVPAGQERLAQLTVRARTPLSGASPRTFPFTVTGRPAEAPRLARQAQGEWLQIPAAGRVTPSKPKRHWFAGCIILFIGLLFTIAVGWGAGALISEATRNDTGLLCASVLWLGGLITTIVLAVKAWKKRPGTPPRPRMLPEE